MCPRQSRKVTWDMINTLFLIQYPSNLLLLLSFSTRKHASMASRAILSNFFEQQWTQNHPQYLSGLLRALFSTTFLEIAVYKFQLARKWCESEKMLCHATLKNLYELKMDVILTISLKNNSGNRDKENIFFASYFADEDLYRRFVKHNYVLSFIHCDGMRLHCFFFYC